MKNETQANIFGIVVVAVLTLATAISWSILAAIIVAGLGAYWLITANKH